QAVRGQQVEQVTGSSGVLLSTCPTTILLSKRQSPYPVGGLWGRLWRPSPNQRSAVVHDMREQDGERSGTRANLITSPIVSLSPGASDCTPAWLLADVQVTDDGSSMLLAVARSHAAHDWGTAKSHWVAELSGAVPVSDGITLSSGAVLLRQKEGPRAPDTSLSLLLQTRWRF
ncbi:hypothetical protein HaLaN_30227, partial [Haematococcus lacustris]